MIPGKRPARGALMLISIGRDESEAWRTDASEQAKMAKDFERLAREKGRRYLEIRDDRGQPLCIREVSC